jgi:hypothetical protein
MVVCPASSAARSIAARSLGVQRINTWAVRGSLVGSATLGMVGARTDAQHPDGSAYAPGRRSLRSAPTPGMPHSEHPSSGIVRRLPS